MFLRGTSELLVGARALLLVLFSELEHLAAATVYTLLDGAVTDPRRTEAFRAAHGLFTDTQGIENRHLAAEALGHAAAIDDALGIGCAGLAAGKAGRHACARRRSWRLGPGRRLSRLVRVGISRRSTGDDQTTGYQEKECEERRDQPGHWTPHLRVSF